MTAAACLPEPMEIRELLDCGRQAWALGRRVEAAQYWRKAATASPDDAPAPYVNLARTGFGRSWVEAAANAIAPDDPVVARNLGVLAVERGDALRGNRHFQRSLVLAPDSAPGTKVFAKFAIGNGRHGTTWAFRAAVLNPTDEHNWHRLVTCLVHAGRLDDVARLGSAVPMPLDRWSNELLLMVFQAYLKSGSEPAALRIATLLVEREPFDPRARAARAVLRRRQGDSKGAIREAMRASVVQPDCFAAAGSVATEACHAERHEDAVALYKRCLRIAPGHRSAVLENYAVSLQQIGRISDGNKLLREVLVQQPALAKPWQNMSTAAFRALDLETASRWAEFATIVDAALASAQFNLAGVRRHQGRADEARIRLARASELSAIRPEYRFARAVLELGDGDPTVGVARYDCRWEVPTFPSYRRLQPEPSLAMPVWQGDLRPDATLAIWGEQGVGDELWFAGYLDWAIPRVGRVLLEVTPHLVGLMAKTFPGVDVRPRGNRETDRLMALADLQLPMGSLMVRYGAGSQPVRTGYLATDRTRIAELRSRYLGDPGKRRIIGLSWRSVKPDKRSSFQAPLMQWRPILELPGAVFVSLQYGDVGADVQAVRDQFGVDVIVDPEIDAYRSLDDFATQVAAIDTVVSIANSTVAMAHGVGRPVHVLLKAIQEDWRYARRRETSRWLPTARCVWQSSPDDWSVAVATVADRLREEL